jgi:peptidoglycan/xylan/chitin deacetylase (PgdA/CDA1 family)
LSATSRRPWTGPVRDFVGYGPNPPKVEWPDGASVVVNIVVNYEEGAEYSVLDGDGFNDTWGEYTYTIPPEIRDIGTESHMEYGSRVGIWRIARMLDSFGVDVSMDCCALALERNPPFCEWIRERNHEIIGHGWRWTEDSRMTRDEERESLNLAVRSLKQTTGQRVVGWIVRSFPSVNTRELLLEDGGFLYDSDACNDELPYYAFPHGEPFLVVPYSKIYNDVKYMTVPTLSTPNHFFENLKMGLDYMLAEAERGEGNRLFTVGIHSRWTGQASRAQPLRDFIEYALGQPRVKFMRRDDIARFWLANHPPENQPRPAIRPGL